MGWPASGEPGGSWLGRGGGAVLTPPGLTPTQSPASSWPAAAAPGAPAPPAQEERHFWPVLGRGHVPCPPGAPTAPIRPALSLPGSPSFAPRTPTPGARFLGSRSLNWGGGRSIPCRLRKTSLPPPFQPPGVSSREGPLKLPWRVACGEGGLLPGVGPTYPEAALLLPPFGGLRRRPSVAPVALRVKGRRGRSPDEAPTLLPSVKNGVGSAWAAGWTR